MHTRIWARRVPWAVSVAALASLALAACGGSSGASSPSANQLLQQTFSGSHKINSGNLAFNLTIDPSGSSTLNRPITFSFGGPFQSRGTGRLPQANFTISANALGKSGSLGIISTGSAGYVVLKGVSYQLPQATFQRLESSFSQAGSSSGASSAPLTRLGIQPMHWLTNATVVGDDSVGGTATTHIRAGINVSALVGDLSTVLQRASSLGVSGANRFSTGISPATASRIASEIKHPTVDVWTGKTDKTMRRLQINLTIPVSGRTSTVLGGLRSADVGLSVQYTGLNQPQTISAPTTVRPFSEFVTKLQGIVQAVQGGLVGGALSGGAQPPVTASGSGSAGSGTTGSGTTGSGGASSTAKVQAYSQCIQAAGNDVAKVQKCAAVLSGK
jgi:hypothetical protein